MKSPSDSDEQRAFRCEHCDGLIRIPAHLPPTTAPCPHCGIDITSPGNESLQIEFPQANLPGDSGDPPSPTNTPSDTEGSQEPETNGGKPSKSLIVGTAACVLILALAGVLFMADRIKDREDRKPDDSASTAATDQESYYIRTGWKKEAFSVLETFLAAESVEEKARHVLNPEKSIPKMEKFYGTEAINDQDTPAETFSVYNLPEQDRTNGMFMLVFDQPPQLDMKNFFRPVASLEVQYGLEEANLLLSSMAQFANFSMEPVRVHALFKMTEDGLKLDWDVYSQTKYRKLRTFLNNPQVGSSGVFRVFINEDVPERGTISSDSRTYRVMDPANAEDIARIKVPLDTELAAELSGINWVGIHGAPQVARTATIEIEWLDGKYEPNLAIKRFICWEYLGLGGQDRVDIERDPRLPEE